MKAEELFRKEKKYTPVSYTHLDVYKRQISPPLAHSWNRADESPWKKASIKNMQAERHMRRLTEGFQELGLPAHSEAEFLKESGLHFQEPGLCRRLFSMCSA